ncbi:hypothetical protein SEA_LIMABEAN_60 [Microbacterium phage LimaBean]|uniref:hypothetical protein n=1 Tax=Microbacterium phage CroZenni TaxID=2836011 RepID=UPI001C755072|nr:hypothetical protein QDW45_gp61 [Microbacterium phage CroZenni]QWY79883.1 hypothetical protein SEA_CROZENNI_61 [Microbacterium phage CroZenni]WIC89549.1 hypothetical protein SEA_LIMABEAN_60 [Microbacterium phage LimaBean]
MANQVPAPEEAKPIEHYVGAAIVTALAAIQEMAPVVELLPPADQHAFVMDVAQRTAKIAGETIRDHHADGKVDI